MAIGPTPGLPELFSGTHPYCLKWFPLLWTNVSDGSYNFSGPQFVGDTSVVAIQGQPICAWRAWTSVTNFIESTGATPADPKLNLIPTGILVLSWFHQKPYVTHHNGKRSPATYELPDGSTRVATTQNVPDSAWNTLQDRLLNDTWPA